MRVSLFTGCSYTAGTGFTLEKDEPGPIDTDMIKHLDTVKLDTGKLADKIKNIVGDPTLKRIDLWL